MGVILVRNNDTSDGGMDHNGIPRLRSMVGGNHPKHVMRHITLWRCLSLGSPDLKVSSRGFQVFGLLMRNAVNTKAKSDNPP
mmetsp:Transcript_4501/g.8337  ORF Transcript_4501/g.8337 Transcript_4501/m.8337 type:complete len:82 (-) Transcript_4501:73-318(-)